MQQLTTAIALRRCHYLSIYIFELFVHVPMGEYTVLAPPPRFDHTTEDNTLRTSQMYLFFLH